MRTGRILREENGEFRRRNSANVTTSCGGRNRAAECAHEEMGLRGSEAPSGAEKKRRGKQRGMMPRGRVIWRKVVCPISADADGV
jgi:hypothetical protein